jgi:hypothetical protein
MTLQADVVSGSVIMQTRGFVSPTSFVYQQSLNRFLDRIQLVFDASDFCIVGGYPVVVLFTGAKFRDGIPGISSVPPLRRLWGN